MARKRRADWGSVTKISPGVYRIRYWAAGPDGYKRRSKTIRGTRKQAGNALAAIRLDHSEDAPSPTLRDCFEKWWLPDRQKAIQDGDLAKNTFIQYMSSWNRHIAPQWGEVPIDQIRPLNVQQWISTKNRNQAHMALVVMRAILDYAVRYELLESNVAAVSYVMPSQSSVNKRDNDPWAVEELMDVCRAVKGLWLEPAVLLAAFGSCRLGEALGVAADDVSLRWVEVDDKKIPVATVPIKGQIVPGSRSWTPRLKTSQSYRTVVLAGEPALRLEQLAKERAGDWLSGGGDGRPPSQAQFKKHFRDALEDFGAVVHPPKSLRSTWETIARWTLHIPPWLSEKMMGHVGEGVTGRHYDKPQEEEFVSVLSKAWAEHPFGDVGVWDDLGPR